MDNAQAIEISRLDWFNCRSKLLKLYPNNNEGFNSESRRNLLPIAGLYPSTFEPPVIAGNRNSFARAIWYLVNALFILNPVLGLIASRWRAALLRCSGERLGRNFVCKPRMSTKYPWLLEIGDIPWISAFQIVWPGLKIPAHYIMMRPIE